MKDCNSMRHQMLTASPEVLGGVGDHPLARHIAHCDACAVVARELLLEAASLDSALGAPLPELDVDALLTRAGRRARRIPGRRRTWTAVALAACAAALLLLVRQEGRTPGAPGPVAPTPMAVASTAPPTVESAPGHDVAVIPTDNPNITVVWYF